MNKTLLIEKRLLALQKEINKATHDSPEERKLLVKYIDLLDEHYDLIKRM